MPASRKGEFKGSRAAASRDVTGGRGHRVMGGARWRGGPREQAEQGRGHRCGCLTEQVGSSLRAKVAC